MAQQAENRSTTINLIEGTPPSPAHSDGSDGTDNSNSEHISMRSKFAHLKFKPTKEIAKFSVVVFFSLFVVVLSITQIIRGVDNQEVYFGMLFWIIGLYTPGTQQLLKPTIKNQQPFSKISNI